MTKKMKKILSLVLLFSMLMSLLSIGAYASTDDEAVPATPVSSQQIENAGGTITSDDGLVTISKTITGSDADTTSGLGDIENVFDITLNVETSVNIEKLTKPQPVSVVLVMDVSYSMVRPSNNPVKPAGEQWEGVTQYAMAKHAADQFIDAFCADAAKNPDVQRDLAIVTFNTNAHTAAAWTGCSTDSSAATLKNQLESAANTAFGTDSKGKVDPLNGYYGTDCDYYAGAGNGMIYTNIEGGLQLAENLLSQKGNTNKYIILMTDGFPTTYISGDRTSTTDIAGYNPRGNSLFKDGLTDKPCTYGTTYSDTGAEKAQAVAQAFTRQTRSDLFAIGINIGGQQLNDLQRNITFSVVDCYAPSNQNSSENLAGYSFDAKGYTTSAPADQDSHYIIGQAGKFNGSAYKGWLRNKISSGTYYWDGDSAAQLNEAFSKIMTKIEVLSKSEIDASWVTEDPMSMTTPGYIEFLSFYDKDGTLTNSDSLTGAWEENGENTASLSSDETISWNLKASGYTTRTEDGKTIYSYTLKYRVRLKNEAAGFTEKTDVSAEEISGVYETNGTTTLTYCNVENGIPGEQKSTNFPIPAVKGYLCELEFTKTAYGEPLNGAEFTLAHAEDCSTCGKIEECNLAGKTGETVSINAMTAVSSGVDNEEKPEGKVTFSNIPSGHEYILTETKAPNGFQRTEDTYRVTAAYDKLTVEKIALSEDGTPVYTPVDLAETGISNQLALDLNASKLLSNKRLENEEFTFELFTKDAEGKETVLQTVKNDADGNVGFHILLSEKKDAYTFYIREVNEDQFGIVYDETVYKADVTLEESKEAAGYDFRVEYTKEDGDGTALNGAAFTNEYLDPVNLTVKKVWDDKDNAQGRRPESIFVQLYKNGEPYGGSDGIPGIVELKAGEEGPAVAAAEITADAVGLNWTYTWSNLDATENWTVKELKVSGYSSQSASETTGNTTTVTITNKIDYILPMDTFRTVKKIWNDNNDAAEKRPASVSVQLMRNGEAYGKAVELNEGNGWGYTWTGLPLDGEYTLTEISAPAGYSASVTASGFAFTVTNTYTGEEPENPPVTPGDPDTPKGGKDSHDPSLDVDDSGIPTGDMDGGNSGVPKTDDNSDLLLWLTITVLAALAWLGLTAAERKKHTF